MKEDMEAEVTASIQNASKGSFKEINSLIGILKGANLEPVTLLKYLNSLKKSIPYITKDHEILIGVVLSLDWTCLDDPIPDAYVSFITELISSKSYYMKVCIMHLIKKFISKKEPLNTQEEITHTQQLEKVHNALKGVNKVAPVSSKYIIESMKINFPYIGKSLYIIKSFIVNMLRVSTTCKGTRYHIVAAIIDRLLSIDVRISREELEVISNPNEELQFDTEIEKEKTANTMIEKLDQLMSVMFVYQNSLSYADNLLLHKDAEMLFRDMLQIFEGIILKTQQSSHVQFLVFYVASFHEDFSAMFIATCWKIFQDPNNAQILRRSAAAYLASFLARANFLDKETVKGQVIHLSDWVHRYLDYQDGSNTNADFQKHAPFYSLCQTLFYVFIYHYKYLLESNQNIAFVKSLNFMRIVTSKLNPLKYCLSTIVNLFARITRIYEIVFCYSIIERNNRNTLRELSFEDQKVVNNELEMYFPFDPYVLPESSRFIKPSYLEWTDSEMKVDSDSDSDNDSNDTLSDEDDEDDEMKPASFDMMCVSPGFQLGHHHISQEHHYFH